MNVAFGCFLFQFMHSRQKLLYFLWVKPTVMQMLSGVRDIDNDPSIYAVLRKHKILWGNMDIRFWRSCREPQSLYEFVSIDEQCIHPEVCGSFFDIEYCIFLLLF